MYINAGSKDMIEAVYDLHPKSSSLLVFSPFLLFMEMLIYRSFA